MSHGHCQAKCHSAVLYVRVLVTVSVVQSVTHVSLQWPYVIVSCDVTGPLQCTLIQRDSSLVIIQCHGEDF